MTREEAYLQIKNGNKITHYDFLSGEYLEYIDDEIKTEDGCNFVEQFWTLDRLKYGWTLYSVQCEYLKLNEELESN